MEHNLIEEYLSFLKSKGRNTATIAEYGWNLAQYAEYLTGTSISSLFAASPETITGYMHAVKERKLAYTTEWRKHHAVFVFYEYLRTTGRLLVNPCPRPVFKTGRKLIKSIPAWKDLKPLFERLRGSEDLIEQRDYAIIDLAYSCGLRRCELQGLNVQDIRADEGTVQVRGKGGRERVVPVGPCALKGLLDYIYQVRPRFITGGSTDALFLSWQKGGTRMTVRSINKVFTRQRKKSGLGPLLSPHNMRHAFATDLVRNGAPLQDVSRMLGHKKLKTTQVYTRVVPMDLKRVHGKFHPRESFHSTNG